MPHDASHGSAIVADDSQMIRDGLRSILAKSFNEVHLASDGLEALEAARATQAALMILDFRMGKLNGIDTCREIRLLPGYQKVPIVILTGYDDERLRREATRAGASLVLRKPVTYEDLAAELAPYITLKRDPAPAGTGLARGRDLLNQRRRIEAETDDARRRYAVHSDRLAPLLGSWGR